MRRRAQVLALALIALPALGLYAATQTAVLVVLLGLVLGGMLIAVRVS